MRSNLRVKICGITQVEQGLAIANQGAKALGFICVQQSPRYVTPERLRSITEVLPASVAKIGVFMNADLDSLAEFVITTGLTAVQLHGGEEQDYCKALRQILPQTEIIKAFRIRRTDDLEWAESFAEDVDWFLLDAYHPDMGGGTGQTLDWTNLDSFRPSKPWFLAGGLNPGNVREALALTNPDGIDLSSGVEVRPGEKDMGAIAALFDQLQADKQLQA
jgi:phosphoribosylanthranilate isomerase